MGKIVYKITDTKTAEDEKTWFTITSLDDMYKLYHMMPKRHKTKFLREFKAILETMCLHRELEIVNNVDEKDRALLKEFKWSPDKVVDYKL